MSKPGRKKSSKKISKKLQMKSLKIQRSPVAAIELMTYGKALVMVEGLVRQGAILPAEFIVKQLITQLPKELPPKVQLLMIHNAMENTADAYGLARTLVASSPRDINVLTHSVRAYREAGNTEDAIALAKRAIELFTNPGHFYNEMGLSYLDSGFKAKAVEAFNQAIKIDAKGVSPYWNRARLIKGSLSEAEIEKMIARSEDKALTDEQSAMLNYAIAWAYEGIDPERHFHYLGVASRLISKNRPWDIREQEDRKQAIINYFSVGLTSETDCYRADLAPLFIAGMPRSGTTLTEQILASHSDVAAFGETSDFGGAIRDVGQAHELAGHLWQWPKKDFVGSLADIDLRFRERLTNYDLDARYFTEKSISNYEYLGAQLMLYPRAKVIHCLRDPLDICLSAYQLYFPRGQEFSFNLRDLALRFRYHIELMDHWKSLFPDRILTIDYESIVEEQEAESRRLLSFCGLEWQDGVLDFYKKQGNLKTASSLQVREPLYNKSVGRWKFYKDYMGPAAEVLGIDITRT